MIETGLLGITNQVKWLGRYFSTPAPPHLQFSDISRSSHSNLDVFVFAKHSLPGHWSQRMSRSYVLAPSPVAKKCSPFEHCCYGGLFTRDRGSS